MYRNPMVYLPLKMNDPTFTIICKSVDLASRLNCLHFKYLNMSLKLLFILIALAPLLAFLVSEKLLIGPRLDNWHEKLLNDG